MNRVFSLPVNQLDMVEINNGDFLKLKMHVISNLKNRNNSEFVVESFPNGMATMKNKPILAYYNTDIKDTEEHNSKLSIDDNGDYFYDYQYDGGEKPVGVIPESADIYTEIIDNKTWIVIDSGLLWVEYNRQLTNLIKKQKSKKVSVEVEILDSHYDENGVEIITAWKFLGVTILGRTPKGELISEGIEGAHLSLKTFGESEVFDKFKKQMSFALNKDGENILNKYKISESDTNEELKAPLMMADDKNGTGETIPVNKSKEDVSHDSWGNVDKTSLRITVLKAKNYKTVVHDVYLLVEDGWEESPSSKLKYPVMQYKDGEFVYNAGGLLSAQQYGEQYDSAIADKAKRIRKNLGLLESEKRDNMKKFIEDAKLAGYVFVGMFDSKLRFAKEADREEMTDKEEMSVFEVDKEFADDCEDKEFTSENFEEKQVKMADEDDDKDDEPDEDEEKKEMSKEIESLKAKCEDFEKKHEEAEEEKEKLNSRCEQAESELKKMKAEKFEKDTEAIMAEDDSNDETKEDLRKMRDDGKFATVEDFVKELAYKKFTAMKELNKDEDKKRLSYSFANFKPNNKEEVDKDPYISALESI